MIRDPIAGHNPEVGYQRLQAVLHTIMLRRTKNSKIDGEPVVSLPERRVRLEQKEFSAEEKEFYEKLRNEADERMKVGFGVLSTSVYIFNSFILNNVLDILFFFFSCAEISR